MSRGPINARARIDLKATLEGGLTEPLHTPTPSLVFRRGTDSDPGPGVIGVIHTDQREALVPGTALTATVVFPEDEAHDVVYVGARFVLWNLRVVGYAEIVSVEGGRP